MQQDEFYIGWQANAPQTYASRSKRAVYILIFVIITLTILYIPNQQNFFNSTFEADNYREIKGVIYQYPVPMLKVKTAENTFQNFVLVDEGKIGAKEFVQNLAKKVPQSLANYQVTLRAELIYYDGKTLLEVPSNQNAEVKLEKLNQSIPEPTIEKLGKVNLKGEIVDPKCYLGAMKPGFGKIHRSCAIRCISGGIPPVFVIHNEKSESEYFILIDKNGKSLNHSILQFVGVPIEIVGELEKVDDWLVLKINPQVDLKRNFGSQAKSVYEGD
jgi:predicted NBD/HSP70 family sugar kinase